MLSFSNTWIFVLSIFLTNDTIGFHCVYIIYYPECLILLHSLDTLFTETNSSWLIYELIKDLEIRTSIVFNLSFPNNTILSCFFFFSYIIELYFLILAVIAQPLISTAEIMIPTWKQANEANIEIETQSVTVETKISKCSA